MSATFDERQRIARAIRAVLAELGAPRRTLGLEEARALAGLAEQEARLEGIAVTIAVADEGGRLVLLHRMEGAIPASVEIAAGKAFTAASFAMATHELGAQAQPGGPLFGIQATHSGRVAILGGGLPCRSGSAVIGAVGVSGGSVEQDIRIAAHALHVFSEQEGLCPEGEKSHG